MATIILGAVGAAVGASLGGGILGLSSVVIGRAIGATVGRIIDQQVLGSGSQAVETGRVERFRLNGAGEGAAVPQLHGRMRVAGHVIWSSRFLETVTTTGGSGKGTPRSPSLTQYSYSVSLAVAVCEGEITRIGRIWADGTEVPRGDLTIRVYPGSEDQLPDPKIEAVEGVAPAYRGIAYVVIEDLQLAPFGNRVPQFSFEVMRPEQPGPFADGDVARGVQGVALMPGTGEYALAVTPVHYPEGPAENRAANQNSPSGQTDIVTSLEALTGELPNCRSVSLIVSWFGDDLRCAMCRVRPKVEQGDVDGVPMPWTVSGDVRSTAGIVVQKEGRPVYGGTPTDQSVVEAIRAMNDAGLGVVFYPFILMEQVEGNGLPDPWSGAADQPALPWRGRITLSAAPGLPGSPDRTAAAEAEVAAFFGTATAAEFVPGAETVGYAGSDGWSYRRFILHYAHLCALAGGVDAFCIGSEMRSLTQIRGAGDSFPAVDALRALAVEVRGILGPSVKITYAADWSEYFGYSTGRHRYFHLDPLWADANIDAIGIDNYMPLSDWRDGFDHADAEWGSIYDLNYLTANIAGGEGYDWYYDNPNAEAVQLRTPITDGGYDEPWVWRYKDLLNWWQNEHYERIDGVRQGTPTAWVPQSKPFWFTEYGCAAIDKGTNEPNKFLDPKSSESALPKYSSGRRDEAMQNAYLCAMLEYWGDPAVNPVSSVYGGRMVDMGRAHVWAWDARPWPSFPNRLEVWSDGENYARGHWLNGRVSARPLARVVAEICEAAGILHYDVSRLYGLVRGYSVAVPDTGRAALQPLMLAYGFDAIERDGVLVFRTRDGRAGETVSAEGLAVFDEVPSGVELVRQPAAEIAGRLRLTFIEGDGDYEARAAEAIFPDEATTSVARSEVPLALTQGEGQAIVERWLAEARVARDGVRLALPLSRLGIGAGDVVSVALEDGVSDFRVDRVEQAEGQILDAVRIERELYLPSDATEGLPEPRAFVPPVPVYPVFLDLPLLRGDELAHAPFLAVTAKPWPGSVAVYGSASGSGFTLDRVLPTAAVIGETLSEMGPAAPGRIDRGPALEVRLFSGGFDGVSVEDMLNGANVAAIGDGMSDLWEVFQFSAAEMTGPDTWRLSGRLRGQAGTDAVAPEFWPAGSIVVLMNGSPEQIGLRRAERGLDRVYRIGPARQGYDDPSYLEVTRAFDGIGLRPLSPVHMRAAFDGTDHAVTWIRRTRRDGDSWQSVDVPLAEERELYAVRIEAGGAVVREAEVSSPGYAYTAAMRVADEVSGPFTIAVAQISAAFGPGPFTRIVVDG